MDHQDIRTLQILEEIGSNSVPSQRALAKKLNVSLGLVNSFMKRLAQKGFFKARTIPRNRVKYILTPIGAAEKTRLTYKYIQHSYQFYKDARQKLSRLCENIIKQGARRVVFYGATEFAEIAFISMQEASLDLVAVVDDQKKGREFLRHAIRPSEDLKALSFDKVLITVLDERDEVFNKLLKMGIPENEIVIFE